MTDKKFEELNEDEFKNLKVEFAPGCFDNFEGTQEELDELISSIKDMFASGEAQKKARAIDFEELDEEDLEIIEKLEAFEENANNRKLQ